MFGPATDPLLDCRRYGGYRAIMGTRSATIAAVLVDSPAPDLLAAFFAHRP